MAPPLAAPPEVDAPGGGGFWGKAFGVLSMVMMLGGDEDQWQRDQAEEDAIDQPVNQTTNQDDDGRTYITYQLRDPNTGKLYAGRASGYGTPEQILAARLSSHHMMQTPNNYTEIVGVDKSARATRGYDDRRNDPAYQAIRGREQQLIDRNGGAQSEGGTSGNSIRGVRANHEQGYTYWRRSNERFGAYAGYTGDPRLMK